MHCYAFEKTELHLYKGNQAKRNVKKVVSKRSLVEKGHDEKSNVLGCLKHSVANFYRIFND